VTTETGTTIGGVVDRGVPWTQSPEMYLDQFQARLVLPAVYLLRDFASDEGGNQQFGFYRPDYTPRKAAGYLHNLTTILADKKLTSKSGKLAYSISHNRQPCMICSSRKAMVRLSFLFG